MDTFIITVSQCQKFSNSKRMNILTLHLGLATTHRFEQHSWNSGFLELKTEEVPREHLIQSLSPFFNVKNLKHREVEQLPRATQPVPPEPALRSERADAEWRARIWTHEQKMASRTSGVLCKPSR